MTIISTDHAPAKPAHLPDSGLRALIALIQDNSYAMSFQTLGQYRSFLIEAGHKLLAAGEA